MNRSTVLAVAAGTAFVGYCIYFDRKRRSHPDYRRRVMERRKANQGKSVSTGGSVFPDLRNVEAVQRFFLEEVQKGEDLLGQGNYDEGVEHLTNAVAVCGQPQQLLSVLQQTLPAPVFAMLLERLPTIKQRLQSSPSASKITEVPSTPSPTAATEKKSGEPAAAAASSPAPTATIMDVDDLE